MKKPLPKEPKQLISLTEFQKLIDKENGYQPSIPVELNAAWGSYCKRTWGAWDRQKQFRLEQLDALDMLNTHELDYYAHAQPIRPI